MPEVYDNPKTQPKVKGAGKASGEDSSEFHFDFASESAREATNPDVIERIVSFDQPSIAFAPDAVGHLVTQLPTPSKNVGFIGELMQDAVPWIEEATKFADIPGQLMQARVEAMQIADPNERENALIMLREIKNLSLDDQFNLLMYLRGRRKMESFKSIRQPGALEASQFDQSQAEVAAGVIEATGFRAEAAGDDVVLTEQYGTTNLIDELKSLFPNINVRVKDESWLRSIGSETGEWILGYESVQHTAEILDEIYREAAAGKKKGVAERGEEFLRVVGGLAGSMADVGFDVAGNVGRNVPVVGDAVTDFAGRQARAAEGAIGKAIEPVLTYGMEPIGKDPNTGEPVFSLEDQKVIESRAGGFVLLTGIGGMVGGSLLGRAGRRLKTANTAAGRSAARAALASSRSTRRGGILGAAAETYRLPVRKITQAIDAGLVAFTRDPEKFFSNGIRKSQGTRLLDTLDAARKAHPGNGQDALDGQAGFIRQVYGDQVNERMAREMLKQTTREGAMRVFVDTVMNPEAGNKVIKRLQGERAKVTARLRELQDPETVNTRPQRRAEAEARLEELRARSESGQELPDDHFDQIRSALDEYNLIKSEDHEISRLRAQEMGLDWQVKTTFDDTPMLKYPKQNVIRAAVRHAPVTRFSRLLHTITQGARFPDLQKTVDELPRYPELFVPGTANSPTNALQQNSNILSNYMQRVGVPPRVIEQNLGALAEVKNRTAFYELVEKQIFGEGGAIDQALHPKLDPEIRSRIINLHDTAVETRTYSTIRESFATPHGPSSGTRPVLGVERVPGEQTPLPSRPTEFLRTLTLPDVELLIEADAFMSRGMRNLSRKGILGAGAHQAVWRLPKLALNLGTLIGKPLVMLPRVLLGAMPLRIQLEQALRSSGFGFKPFKGIPDGVSLFPGGIPIPLTNVRLFKGLFGQDGWKMMAPDERMEGFSSPDESDMGMFMSEAFEGVPTERVVESTIDFRTGKRTPQKMHFEAFRKELEQAHMDFVDRKLAQLDLDTEKFLEWLDKDPAAKRYMEIEQKPEIARAYPPGGRQGVEDGAVIQIPAHQLIEHLEFPNRAILADEVGRTPQQIQDLRASLAQQGYDPDFVPPGGTEPVGPLRMEFNPVTGEALVREGHHRIGVAAELDQTVPVRIERVTGFEGVRGADIDEVDASAALRGLSELSGSRQLTEVRRISESLVPRDHPSVDDPVRTWAESRVTYLKQLTKENPKYIDTIATGKSRSLSRLGKDFSEDGRSVVARHDQLTEKVDIISDTIKDKLAERAPAHEIAALQNERKLAMREVSRLQRENPQVLEGVKAFKLEDKGRWTDHLKEEWAQGRMELPDRLVVEKRITSGQSEGGMLNTLELAAQTASNAMYKPFKILSYADKHGTRGSLYTQAYQRMKAQYLARGLDEKTADAMGYARAAEMTMDMMYDLNARTSLQRSLKDIMWFAPAWQEVAYTWLVKIPSQAYWPIGAASQILKLGGLIDVLAATGVIQNNSDGEQVITIPGLGGLIEKLTGTKVPDVVFGKLSGLNLITTGGGVPGLSIPANFALGKAALAHGGVFKELSDIFQPYGPETSALPQSVTYWWEALTGSAPTFEFASPDKMKADWDRAFDYGIQYAYSELTAQGINPPRPEDFGAEKAEDGTWVPLTVEQQTAYTKATKNYINELMSLGKRYQRGIAFVRAIGSTASPMSLNVTSKERDEWDNFWNKIIVPTGFEDTGMSEAQRDLIDDYLEDHPTSMAFSVFYKGQGEKVSELPFPEDLDDAFYDSYYTGESVTLSPKDYSQKLLASESKRFYVAQLDSVLKEISPEGDPWELLTHGSEKKDALDQYHASMERWKFLNPKAAALLEEQSAFWRENNSVPLESFEVERTAETIRLIRQMAPMMTGEEGIRPEYVRRTLTDLNIFYSENGDFGPANTPQEKAMEWYFAKVFEPRVQETADLYAEAARLDAQSLPSSHIYNEIREIYNKPYPKYKGETVPSVEAIFFGNRNEDERKATVLSWRSRPLAWLSDFQLETAGYPTDERSKDFLDSVSQYDEDMWNYIRNKDISFSSNEYDQLKQQRVNNLTNQARALGPDILRLWQLNESAPYVRLNDKGFGFLSPQWRDLSASVASITQRIENQGYSPKSFSEYATQQKIFLYRSLANAREDNILLDKLFVDLSYSFPLPEGGGYREGASLYEAVFFGNFNTDFIPFDVASAAQVAA
jgi:hypothetical protein